jgi:hypothetical protein
MVFEEGLLLRSAIALQLQPPLGRKFTLAKSHGLGDVGQKFRLECVRHRLERRRDRRQAARRQQSMSELATATTDPGGSAWRTVAAGDRETPPEFSWRR